MVDATSVIDAVDQELPLDTVNTVNILLALFVPLSLAVLGVNTFQSLPVITVSLVFFGLIAVALLLTRNSLLASEGTFQQLSFAFIAGAAVFLIPSIRSGAGLTVFSLPTSQDAYLSVLAQTPQPVQVLVNGFLAPYLETFALVSLAIITVIVLNRNIGLNPLLSVGGAAGLAALVFAFLHGARGTAFFLTAFAFMFISIGLLLGEELDLVSIPVVGVSLSFLIGLHLGNNIAALGGLSAFYGVLLGAAGPVGTIGLVITLWHLVLLAGAVLFVVDFIF